jgi:hypothetical protein
MVSPSELTRNYFCPLCGSNHYELVGVHSQKSGRFVIVDGLFQCAGCSAVFTDPAAWTQLMRDSIIDAARYVIAHRRVSIHPTLSRSGTRREMLDTGRGVGWSRLPLRAISIPKIQRRLAFLVLHALRCDASGAEIRHVD